MATRGERIVAILVHCERKKNQLLLLTDCIVPETTTLGRHCLMTFDFSNPVKAVGWSILLFLIVLGALGRLLKPCFEDHGTFLQTRYWSNYLDVEQKLFDETCVLHARDFARKCVVQFFEDVRENNVLHLPHPPNIRWTQERWEDEDDRLHGISKQHQMNQLLNKWYYSKPELDVTRMAYRPRPCVTWDDCNGKSLYSDV